MDIRILFLVNRGHAGGDIYFKNLKESLESYTDIKTDLIYIPPLFEKTPFLLPFYLKFIRKINLSKYNLIHANAEFGHFFRTKGRPLFVTVHHIVFDDRYQKYTSLLQKLFHYFWIKPNLSRTLRIADRVIAVSNYTKNQTVKYFRVSPQKIEVIHNGIDIEKFKPVSNKIKNTNEIRLLFVGNLIKRKGVDLLPKIMNKLEDEYVLYYTSGLRTRNIFQHKRMFSLRKLTQEELIKEYNKCDILLLPTRLEGFGYAVAEAMACGKPVVTTNCSSLPEIVKNGENGFLCEMNNVDDFVEKIKILEGNKKLREKIGKVNRRKIVQNFSLEKMVKRYTKLYKTLIKQNESG